jgi:cytochrome P450
VHSQTVLCCHVRLTVLLARRLQDAATASRVLRNHLTEMISERRAELNGDDSDQGIARKDILSLLVRASEEDTKFHLSDDELVSDNMK